MPRKLPGGGPIALVKIKKFFPSVRTVRDAKSPVEIEVTSTDASSKAVRDHTACAMAVACKRKLHLDGVIISRSIAYLVKDRVATRYSVPTSVAKEVVAFDRGGAFAPGEYYLAPIKGSQLLGMRSHRNSKDRAEPGDGKKRRKPHITRGIRAALGGVKRNGN